MDAHERMESLEKDEAHEQAQVLELMAAQGLRPGLGQLDQSLCVAFGVE